MPIRCLFVTDLHGHSDRYEKLFREIPRRRPAAIFIGGDLLPSPLLGLTKDAEIIDDFVEGFVGGYLERLRKQMGESYPAVFVILGNDDGSSEEPAVEHLADKKLWHYAHNRCVQFAGHQVYGYAYVPPTPFRLKDWERYDVSRYTPHGCISPEDGAQSGKVPANVLRYSTIADDLAKLTDSRSMERAVFLFHTPPHDTMLDRAALDGKMVDGVPLDVHVGSIAVRRFIESRQPLVTLHGHIHESARLTGAWRDRLGSTHMFNAAHDGAGLALIDFDLENLDLASRDLV